MFITKGILELHHGKIRVFSDGEGSGSTFVVDLPMTRKIPPELRRSSISNRVVGWLRGNSGRAANNINPLVVASSSAASSSHDASNLSSSSTSNQQRKISGPITALPLSGRSQGTTPPLLIIDPMFPDQEEEDMNKTTTTTTNAAALSSVPTIVDHTRDDAVYTFNTSCVVSSANSAKSSRSQKLLFDEMVTTSPPSPSPSPGLELLEATSTTATSALLSVSRQLQNPLSDKEQPQQSSGGYHVLVVDDSAMTRKMLMKTLRSKGLTPLQTTLTTLLSSIQLPYLQPSYTLSIHSLFTIYNSLTLYSLLTIYDYSLLKRCP